MKINVNLPKWKEGAEKWAPKVGKRRKSEKCQPSEVSGPTEDVEAALQLMSNSEFCEGVRARFVLVGKPQVTYRTMMNYRKNGTAYMFSPTSKETKRVRALLRGAMSLTIPANKNVFERKTNVMVTVSFYSWTGNPGRRADLDNLVKFILDTMSKSVYNDDIQVLGLIVEINNVFEESFQKTVVSVKRHLPGCVV